jgi:hypothetical protein
MRWMGGLFLDLKWHKRMAMPRGRGHCSIQPFGLSNLEPRRGTLTCSDKWSNGLPGTLPCMAGRDFGHISGAGSLPFGGSIHLRNMSMGGSIEMGIRCGGSEAGYLRQAACRQRRAGRMMGPVPAGTREGFEAHFQTESRNGKRSGKRVLSAPVSRGERGTCPISLRKSDRRSPIGHVPTSLYPLWSRS